MTTKSKLAGITIAVITMAASQVAYACNCGCKDKSECGSKKKSAKKECSTKHSHDHTHADHSHAKDIVDTAVAAGSFKTLVAAVTAADLGATLKSEGPFTVFAPTDAAFAKLPAGTLESLLKPENKDQLIAILKYHVVAGKVTAEQVVTLDSAETVNGAAVTIAANEQGVKVGEANVIKTDIDTSNGIIHVIDSVLIPSNT